MCTHLQRDPKHSFAEITGSPYTNPHKEINLEKYVPRKGGESLGFGEQNKKVSWAGVETGQGMDAMEKMNGAHSEDSGCRK